MPLAPRRSARTVLCLVPLTAVGVCPAGATPGSILSSDLENGAAASSFVVRTASERTPVDATAVFGYDYSARGIVAAPGQTTTRGLLVQANTVDNGTTPESVGVAVYPSAGSFTGDFVFTVMAYAFTSGAANQTTTTGAFTAGLFGDGTRGNYLLANNTDGYFWHLSTDGGATNDLLALVGSPGAPPSAIVPLDIHNNPEVLDTNAAGYPLAGVPGFGNGANRLTNNFALNSPENQWVELAVGRVHGDVFFAIRATGATGVAPAGGEAPIEAGGGPWVVLDSFDTNFAGALTTGLPFFGYADLNDSANADVGAVFDRVRAHGLRAGDSDFDGDVDLTDVLTLRANYSGSGVATDTGAAVPGGFDAHAFTWTRGDTNGDRDVDLADANATRLAFTGLLDAATSPGRGEPVVLTVDALTGTLTLTGGGTVAALSVVSADGALVYGDAAVDAGTGLELTLSGSAREYAAMSLDAGVDVSAGGWVLPVGVSSLDGLSFEYALLGDAAVRSGVVTVVPEPAALLALAGAGLALRRRRV